MTANDVSFGKFRQSVIFVQQVNKLAYGLYMFVFAHFSMCGQSNVSHARINKPFLLSLLNTFTLLKQTG